jgi:hypothetical protein
MPAPRPGPGQVWPPSAAELYRPYGTAIVLDRCFDLAVHHDPAQGAVVLEYAPAGMVVPAGAPYGNRYISVLTLRDREIVHWRDYLDPVAVFDALGWPSRGHGLGGYPWWLMPRRATPRNIRLPAAVP